MMNLFFLFLQAALVSGLFPMFFMFFMSAYKTGNFCIDDFLTNDPLNLSEIPPV